MYSIMAMSPKDLEKKILNQIINLILEGGQVQINDIKTGLERAYIISYIVVEEIVVCTASLKKPKESYVERIFKEAEAYEHTMYTKELGYIATRSEYEGKGYCQLLLNKMQSHFENDNIFATTRKTSMIHILKKLGFKKLGKLYKTDLQIMVLNMNKDILQSKINE